jgi:ABC-2 type transport system ATP-binding protein
LPVLQISGLTRSFKNGGQSVLALRGVNLSLREGEIVGLLGTNGAGKTTLIKIVSTLLLPTSGSVHICGLDVVSDHRKARRLFAVVLGGERGFYSRLTGMANAVYFATLAGLPRRAAERECGRALAEAGLTEAAHRRVETYSKGMRQRLHLAVGFVTRPPLLLLDEPTVGLDPIEAQRLRDALARIREHGTAILLTSHYLGDIEQLATRVAVLREGVITEDRPLAELLDRAGGVAEVTVRGIGGEFPPVPDVLLSRKIEVVHTDSSDDGWRLILRLRDWSPDSLRELADWWPAGMITDVSVRPIGLEAMYADLVRPE